MQGKVFHSVSDESHRQLGHPCLWNQTIKIRSLTKKDKNYYNKLGTKIFQQIFQLKSIFPFIIYILHDLLVVFCISQIFLFQWKNGTFVFFFYRFHWKNGKWWTHWTLSNWDETCWINFNLLGLNQSSKIIWKEKYIVTRVTNPYIIEQNWATKLFLIT